MTFAQIVSLAIQAGIVLMVFSVGLRVRLDDSTYLLRHPVLLFRALAAMLVVGPMVAIGLALAFDLHPAVKIMLVAMAISPVAPLLPLSQMKAGGAAPYVIGLLAATALLSIVLVPLLLVLIDGLTPHAVHIPPLQVAKVVGISVLLPLFAGIAVRSNYPILARRMIEPAMMLVTLLLGASALVLGVSQWPVIQSLIGNGTLASITVVICCGMAAGHYFGGPDEGERTALVMACAARHPAVALAIAQVNFPKQHDVTAAVLLALLLGALLPRGYVWLQRKGMVHREA